MGVGAWAGPGGLAAALRAARPAPRGAPLNPDARPGTRTPRQCAARRRASGSAGRGAHRLPSCWLSFPAAAAAVASARIGGPALGTAPPRAWPAAAPGPDPPLSTGVARGPRLGGGQFPPALRLRFGARSGGQAAAEPSARRGTGRARAARGCARRHCSYRPAPRPAHPRPAAAPAAPAAARAPVLPFVRGPGGLRARRRRRRPRGRSEPARRLRRWLPRGRPPAPARRGDAGPDLRVGIRGRDP